MIFDKKNNNVNKFLKDIAFLEKARLKKDYTKEYMNGINVEYEEDKVFLVATNGKSISYIEYEKEKALQLEEGFYRFKKCTKDIIILEKEEEEIIFPNWRLVIPQENIKVLENFYVYGNKPRKDHFDFYELIFILNNLGCCVNPNNLFPIIDLDITWDVYVNPYFPNGKVMIKNNTSHYITPGKYTIVSVPITYRYNDEILNALYLIDEILRKDINKERTLFEATIYRNNKELFELIK